MSADDFRRDITYLLRNHWWGDPLCTECSPSNWQKWRDHVVDLIVAARDKADQARRIAPVVFVDLLAEHAPFGTSGGGLACNSCIDGNGLGEFTTTREWAQHFEAELGRTGLKVAPRGVLRRDGQVR